MNREWLHNFAAAVHQELLRRRQAAGQWEGHLADSALSTATAVTALALYRRVHPEKSTPYTGLITKGLEWLAGHQNEDGGWGDTTRSLSNISTSALGWAAFGATKTDETFAPTVARAAEYLSAQAGSLAPRALAQAITRRYGKDKTFSVPILTMCALAGRLGPEREAWKYITPPTV